MRQAEADAGREDDLAKGAGNHHPPYGQQIGHGEMQAHAEHQQHDADLGQLAREGAIGDEAGSIGADRHPRDEVADQRRRAQARGKEAAEERQGEPDGEGGDEHHIVRHARPSLS